MKSVFSPRVFRGCFLAIAFALASSSGLAQQTPAQQQRRVPPRQQLQTNEGQSEGQQFSVQQSAERAKPRPAPVPAKLDRVIEKLKVTEPVTHANLSIYLLEGDDRADTTKVLTLAEALAGKDRIIVKETGNVNELTVENKDAEHTVFIMAGDIVKGGKQDRTLGVDLPLMTKHGVVPITAFCVEQGRWRARGAEDVSKFSTSLNAVSTKDSKIAVRRAKAQGEVWQSVAKAQEKISANVGKPVAAAASPSSLQLSLEDKVLKTKNAEFFKSLMGIVKDRPRAIGYVCVINGHINSAEIFAGHDLFSRAWPKLLEATATEAISEQKEKAAPEPATAEKVTDFLAKSEDIKATKEQIHGSFWNVSGESESTLVFQTIDESAEARWLRRSIIKK